MTVSISITAHGQSEDTAKKVFSDAVRALRADGDVISGSVSGSDGEGKSFTSLGVNDVEDEEEE